MHQDVGHKTWITCSSTTAIAISLYTSKLSPLPMKNIRSRTQFPFGCEWSKRNINYQTYSLKERRTKAEKPIIQFSQRSLQRWSLKKFS